jgi:hypothetical protein
MDGLMDGLIDGLMDGLMDGWTDGWMDTYILKKTYTSIQSVRMKGIQNKKMYISETNCHTRIQFMSSERKTLDSFFFHARLTRMRQLVPFGELSNNVDTTVTASMRVVTSRIAISYGCPASF